jgi:alkanesulfonate monooxygenase SsuD/methylene tetrahydromethanopterin reductase-like flavin-dependent oxidoreductase (luciferase family)
MKAGLIVPQGWFGEFEGWDPVSAWNRCLDIARMAERLGFDSVWTGEHVQTKWGGEQVLFECVTMTTAIAVAVPRIGIGFTVLNSTLRNPALTAKMAATIDVVSNGRLTLGLGAGFRQDEVEAFGYEFPSLGARLSILGENLEVISRMVTRDEPPFSFDGAHVRVRNVVNNPRSVQQPRIPLLIGGHGPNVTFRLAARYCDEINLDVLPSETPAAIALLHQRCEEVGRDPSTLAVSVGISPAMQWKDMQAYGQRMAGKGELAFVDPAKLEGIGTRGEALQTWEELGVDRVMIGVPGLAASDDPMEELVADCRRAGLELASTSDTAKA